MKEKENWVCEIIFVRDDEKCVSVCGEKRRVEGLSSSFPRLSLSSLATNNSSEDQQKSNMDLALILKVISVAGNATKTSEPHNRGSILFEVPFPVNYSQKSW